ncbi:cytidylyltransferase domain-containing protein [Dyadobacter tibetensis]|uniref:cytidylyltransferase domain-containing protein n=1 Tax=Dyadobacter tibetensis TaxID=1211851 RepID=UPI00046ED22C|nr:N-acetylneuraminate synthase family protein [Dyadobacter tibetensis]
MIYQIIEVANTHAGKFDYLQELIETFSVYTEGYGIKFQPLKPETLATADYEWFGVYQQLYFDNQEWATIIDQANQTKDVWLDLFDAYGVSILKENLSKVYGIKFQSSVLYNYALLDQLSNVDLSDKRIILNLAAQPLSDIQEIVDRFESQLKPKEILFEIGFQGYPTTLADSGLNKIRIIKEKFANRLVFADHTDGNSDDALWLPVVAAFEGAEVVEKHVMLSNRETKFDFYSSLTPERFQVFTENIIKYFSLLSEPFINRKEEQYLEKSLMVPILNKNKDAGSGINLIDEVDYKRSGKNGLNVKSIESLINNYHILGADKTMGDSLKASDFKKASIGAVIACRMKSTRLKKKALLKIGDLSSIELCIKNTLSLQNVNTVVLATSTEEEDAILKDYTYDPRVKFHQGHPIDVMQRVLEVLDLYNLDIFIRITGDNPFISNEILEILLASHFETGADYTSGRATAFGVNLEIINTAALRKVKSFFPMADYSEYMTYYFWNNPEYFSINMVDLPEDLVRSYRLTLDYDEDLLLYNNIVDYLSKEKLEMSLKNIFAYLDANPEVAAMNSGVEVKYHTDKDLIKRIFEHTKIKQ